MDENIPITACEKKSYRKFAGTKTSFSYKRMKEVMQKLCHISEQGVADEMKKAGKGVIMHDAWTCAGIHYVALFASYIRTITVVEKGKVIEREETAIVLLSCAPIETAREVDEFEADEEDNLVEIAAQFNAEKYAEHFERIFRKYYKIDLREWAVAATSDNAAVNLKLTKILGLQQIPCGNHLLNLDVKEFVKNDVVLNELVDSISDVMRQVKMSIKNTAVLKLRC